MVVAQDNDRVSDFVCMLKCLGEIIELHPERLNGFEHMSMTSICAYAFICPIVSADEKAAFREDDLLPIWNNFFQQRIHDRCVLCGGCLSVERIVRNNFRFFAREYDLVFGRFIGIVLGTKLRDGFRTFRVDLSLVPFHQQFDRSPENVRITGSTHYKRLFVESLYWAVFPRDSFGSDLCRDQRTVRHEFFQI